MVKFLLNMKALILVALLGMTAQSASAYDNFKEFFFKVTVTAEPTGAGKVYVSYSTTEPDADKYAETAEDTGVTESGYDEGDPEPEQGYGERELWAKPNPGFQFKGWSTAEDPTTIISTNKHFTAEDFVVTATDKENPTVVSYIANFKESGAIEDGLYYIRNVESGKFISQGQWWGTHATLDGDGLEFDVIYDETSKTYTIQSALGYFGNDEYVDAPEVRIGKWGIELKDGVFTMSEGGRNLCVDGVNVYLNADNAAANWEFVPVSDRQVSSGTFAKPAEMTYMIKHPNFEANKDAWVIEGTTNMNSIDGNRGGDFTAESWNSANFSVKQTVEGLKSGIYRLTFNGYYRYNVEGGENNNSAAIAAHAEGTEVINAYVQLNNTEKALLSVADEASIELAGGVAPNSITEAQAAFAKGAYVNEVIAAVGEDGILEIAIKKDQQANVDWAIFDNLQLEYLGGFPAISGGEINVPAHEYLAGSVVATFNIAGTGINIEDESLIQVKKGEVDEDGWWSFDNDVEGAVVSSELEEIEDGTTNLIVTVGYNDFGLKEQYRVFIQKGALSCYGLSNSSRAQNTLIMPDKAEQIAVSLVANDSIEYTLNTHSTITVDEPISAIKVAGLDQVMDSVTYAIYGMDKATLASGLLSVNTIGYAEFAPVTLYEAMQYNVVIATKDSVLFDQIVIGAAEKPEFEIAATIGDSLSLNTHSAISAEAMKTLEVTFDGIVPTMAGYSVNTMKQVVSEEASTWEVDETLAQGALSLSGKGFAELDEWVVFETGKKYCVIVNYVAGSLFGEVIFEINGACEDPTAINAIATSAKANGKFLENNKIVIVKSGVKYNVAGSIVK